MDRPVLLKPGRRQRDNARARIRAVLALEAHVEEPALVQQGRKVFDQFFTNRTATLMPSTDTSAPTWRHWWRGRPHEGC